MDAFSVLVVITLVLVCMCCMIYIVNHIRQRITFIVRVVLKELKDIDVEDI
jgi:uncharacterized membrane protein